MSMELQKLDFTKLDTMEIAIASNNQLQESINDCIKNYHTIDVSVAMKNLANVGNILKLAYAGSKGFPCSKNTIEILSKYQSMIKNSYVASASFVDACLSALKYHKMAILMADKDKFDSSRKMIEKCSELAHRMATKSEELVEEATALCNLSEKALITANEDENVSEAEKKKITQMITESRAKAAELQKKTEMLYKQIEDYKKQQEEIAKKADEERSREFGLKIVSAIMTPITKVAEVFSFKNDMTEASSLVKTASNTSMVEELQTRRKEVAEVEKKLAEVQDLLKNLQETSNSKNKMNKLKTEEAMLKEKLESLKQNLKEFVSVQRDDNNNNQKYDSQAAILEQKERQIITMKNELQKEEREANAEISKIGELLKGLSCNEKDLSASICSLQLAIKALGKIKTIFEHTRQFWLGVETHCKTLSDIGVLKELSSIEELKDEYITELKKSGLSWLSLGKINYNAQLSIREVDKKADSILNDLPTKLEALSIVQNEADIILMSLNNEKSILNSE